MGSSSSSSSSCRALILAGGLAWFHLRASPIIGGRPGLVWVAVSWCFVSAAVVAVPGMALVLALASEAVNGSDNRGDERLLVDFGWILACVGAISLCLGLAMVSLGLSVRRGAPWSRWVTAIISSLVSLNFVGLAAKQLAQEEGPSGIALLLLVLPAALPLPFLFWFGGRFHFAPERVALPVPPPPPERFPEAPALSDRWHSRR